jgi:fructosamine-3-kinase
MLTPARERELRVALRGILGRDSGAVELQSAGGGSINQAAVVSVDGRRFFLKWNDRPLPRQFEAESAGLAALREAATDLRVPEPLAHRDGALGESFLLLEYLEPGRAAPKFDERLGRGLAELHRHGSERGFGFSMDGYCGATPQPNPWMNDWSEFYVQQRIGHQLTLAGARGMDRASLNVLHRLCARLPEWLADDEPPALIHGDLWSGNLHVATDGSPAILDPAAYFAHREAELGMMSLFGGFSRRVWDAYHEAYPLRDGWRERLDLYALYHVLNHFVLFGGGYGAQALRIAGRYL